MNDAQMIGSEFYNTIFTEVRGESLTSTKVESVNLDLGSYYVAAHFFSTKNRYTKSVTALTTKPKLLPQFHRNLIKFAVDFLHFRFRKLNYFSVVSHKPIGFHFNISRLRVNPCRQSHFN